MEINNEFKNAVQEQDVLLIRVMLKNSMWRDPTFKEFNELLAYAEKNVDNLYDKHDGEDFIDDKSQWDRNLLAEQQAKCLDNFSHERVTYLRKLCRYLYADKIKSIENERRMQSIESANRKEKRKNVMIAGAGVAAVGLIAGSTVLTVAGVAVVGYGLLNNVDE